MIFNKASVDDEIKDLSIPCEMPKANILSDEIDYCEGDTTTLTLSRNDKCILWSTGEKNLHIKVTKPGKHSVAFCDKDTCKGYSEKKLYF